MKGRRVSALGILGAIYTPLGGSFLLLGIGLLRGLAGTEEWFIGLIFAGIGSVFLGLGVIFLIVRHIKGSRSAQLVQQGRYVWGEITRLMPNYNIRLNGRNPYVAVIRYVDSRGQTHLFKSENLHLLPDSGIIGRQVRVYYQDESFKRYYVDMAPVLGDIIEH